MQRITVDNPRTGWESIIREQGLIYDETILDNGKKLHYWNETHAYQFTEQEVLDLEEATEQLHRMSLEAARFIADEQYKPNSPFKNFGISKEALEYATYSLDRSDPYLYGRFDLAYSGIPGDAPKMLEYNADTPTGLIEGSIVQWYWKEHHFPDADQWNGIHEALISRFEEMRAARDSLGTMYFAWTSEDTTGEDVLTVGYMLDCAQQAGWENPQLIDMKNIEYDYDEKIFYDPYDNPINNIFKLYPWEDMMDEEFGPYIAKQKPQGWLEPAWKMFLSTKMLLPALWHLYPGHEYLLPSYIGSPTGMEKWVKKPLHGREGDGITINAGDVQLSPKQSRWGDEGYVYQEYVQLPNYVGDEGESNYPVLGTWMIGDDCRGVGIRESDGPLTDYYCRFVPNIIVD